MHGDPSAGPGQALPRVPVYDLVIKDNDLIAATHGRSFWVLDDLTQLHQITSDLAERPFHLLEPRTTCRLRSPFRARKPVAGKSYRLATGADVTYTETRGPEGETVRKFLDAGQNPPDGVIITYYLKEKREDEVTLSFLDTQEQLIKTFSSKPPEVGAQDAGPLPEDVPEPRVRAEAGMNRFVWNLRYPLARKVPGDKSVDDVLVGPLAPPGTYQVKLTVGDQSQTQTFQIIKEPRVAAQQEDFDAQFQLLIKIRDKLSETHDSINKLRSIRRQVEEWVRRAEGSPAAEAVSSAADALKEKLSAIENELVQVKFKGARDRLDLPVKLNRKLAELSSVVASADFAPTRQTYEVFDHLTGRIDPQLQQLQEVIQQDVTRFINLVRELDIPPIVPSTAP
jgi:hypothetical protein